MPDIADEGPATSITMRRCSKCRKCQWCIWLRYGKVACGFYRREGEMMRNIPTCQREIDETTQRHSPIKIRFQTSDGGLFGMKPLGKLCLCQSGIAPESKQGNCCRCEKIRFKVFSSEFLTVFFIKQSLDEMVICCSYNLNFVVVCPRFSSPVAYPKAFARALESASYPPVACFSPSLSRLGF
jgi:hypothetical protein